MSTAETIAYCAPTKTEAKQLAALKVPAAVLDRADIASLSRAVFAIEERRAKIERSLASMAADTAGLRDILELLRMQLD